MNNFPNNYSRRPKHVATKQDSDNVITEQTGYLSTKQLVENMVLAGKRLYDYRHGLLDVEDVGVLDEFDEEQDAARPYERDMVDEALDIDRKMARRKKDDSDIRVEEHKPSDEKVSESSQKDEESRVSGSEVKVD